MIKIISKTVALIILSLFAIGAMAQNSMEAYMDYEVADYIFATGNGRSFTGWIIDPMNHYYTLKDTAPNLQPPNFNDLNSVTVAFDTLYDYYTQQGYIAEPGSVTLDTISMEYSYHNISGNNDTLIFWICEVDAHGFPTQHVMGSDTVFFTPADSHYGIIQFSKFPLANLITMPVTAREGWNFCITADYLDASKLDTFGIQQYSSSTECTVSGPGNGGVFCNAETSLGVSCGPLTACNSWALGWYRYNTVAYGGNGNGASLYWPDTTGALAGYRTNNNGDTITFTPCTGYTYYYSDKQDIGIEAMVTFNNITNNPSISISSYSNALCNGGTGRATASPASGGTSPYIYSWSPHGGTNLIASNLTAGTYTITVTDANSNTASASVTITAPTVITANAVVNANATACTNNGSATVTAGGGTSPYTYSWNGGNTNANATGLSAGAYMVTVKDNNGCTASASATITQPGTTLSVTHDSVSDDGSCNGLAAVTVHGGTSPYTYLWTPGSQTTDTIKHQCARTYCCNIWDNNGCNEYTCVTVKNASATGIDNISSSSSVINLYPNPNTGYFTLTGLTQDQVIKIYNYFGQEIQSRLVDKPVMRFDLSATSNGVYLIRILNQDGSLAAQKKIVKTQ